MKRIYIAGPYTKGDVAVNVAEAIRVGNEVAALGYFPFIPHLTHFWHMLFPHPYEHWLAQDNAWVPLCDALLRIPGESSGADLEMKLALSEGLLVVHSVEELLEVCPPE